MRPDRFGDLVADVATCRRCPRLVAWREATARTRVARYRDSTYWGRPVPGFGDPEARVLLVGLAPAAHGGNRTGRVFTGDNPGGSGELLFEVLYRAGFSPRPRSIGPSDGLQLEGLYIAAVNRCAPPANRPTTEERDNCLPYLVRELRLLSSVQVIVALGGFAWTSLLIALRQLGHEVATPRPRFAHGAEVRIGPYVILGCYHPSQQNTFTGRLTPAMLDDVMARARALSGDPAPSTAEPRTPARRMGSLPPPGGGSSARARGRSRARS